MSPCSACLLALYVDSTGNPPLPAIEEIFTMCPKPRDNMPMDIMETVCYGLIKWIMELVSRVARDGTDTLLHYYVKAQ